MTTGALAAAPSEAALASRGQWRPGREDRWPLIVLVAIPVLLFATPAVLGHPPLAGDNLLQNFPLRVLSGRILATGHLPLWNRLTFSGTPLLGGLNAGALYPLTLLFAVIPSTLAWVINLAACYWAAGIGLYVLARWLRLSPVSAFLGAITYSYMGMMVGQMVHLGVIQGQGWMPWVVLVALEIGQRGRSEDVVGLPATVRALAWPTLWLTVLSATIYLTGEPRSIVDMEIVAVVVGLYALFLGPGRRGRAQLLTAASYGIGAFWGALIAAVQLLPGVGFINLSQRSNISSDFFGSGSLSLNKTILLGIPDFFGGTGLLHQPTYFIDYNLPDVTGYLGLLGLVAVFAGAAQLIGRSRRSPRWILLFVSLFVVGVVFAWGEFTPLIHLMGHIPLLNKTRLQSRNLAIADLGGAVLVAWFADRLVARDFAAASMTGWRRWVTVSPLLATLLALVVALLWPFGFEELAGASSVVAVEGHYLSTWFLIELALVLAVLGVLIGASRLSAASLRRALVLVVTLDAVFFVAACTTGLLAGDVPVEPSRAYAASILGIAGRSALVDPAQTNYDEFIRLGEPNTNVFTSLPSVQGYGSLVDGTYGDATGAHKQNDLDPCQLALGRFRQLRLETMVIAGYELAPAIYSPVPGSGVSEVPPADEQCPGAPHPSQASRRTFFFGRSIDLSHIFLAARSSAVMTDPALADSLHVSVLLPNGALLDAPTTIRRLSTGWSIQLSRPRNAIGIEVTGPVHKVMSESNVTSTAGIVYFLDGPFQNVLDDGAWRFVQTTGTLSVFVSAPPIKPPVWIAPHPSPGSSVLYVHTMRNGTQHDGVVVTSPSTVVRSESALPGWQASYAPMGGGTSHSTPVLTHDLVQAVHLPPGRWVVTFIYHAPHIHAGVLLSGAGVLALVVAAGAVEADRRRRRRTLGG